MKFNLTLNSYQLAELKAKLSGLITEMDYDQSAGMLSINADQKNEASITDLVMPYMPIVEELPDWGEMARRALKEKRLATTREHDALAAIARKRRLQEAAA